MRSKERHRRCAGNTSGNSVVSGPIISGLHGGIPAFPESHRCHPSAQNKNRVKILHHHSSSQKGITLGRKQSNYKTEEPDESTILMPAQVSSGGKATKLPQEKPQQQPLCTGRATTTLYLWQCSSGGVGGHWHCWGPQAAWAEGCRSGWLHTSRSAGCWA